MKRPAAVLRRPAAAQKKILQTDAEPAGPAPLGTSDVEKELEALQLCKTKRQKKDCVSSKKEVGEHGKMSSMYMGQEDEESSLPSKGRKEVKGKSLSAVLTPTSMRRGSHVAERKPIKRPASKRQPCASVMDSSPTHGREPHSAGAASQSSGAWAVRKGLPNAILFIDIRSAFYTIVRQSFTALPNDNAAFLQAMTSLGMMPEDIGRLLETTAMMQLPLDSHVISSIRQRLVWVKVKGSTQ